MSREEDTFDTCYTRDHYRCHVDKLNYASRFKIDKFSVWRWLRSYNPDGFNPDFT